MRIVVRLARAEDAASLSVLAARIFYDTFAAITPPDDMQRFLTSTYNEDRQREEIADPEIVTLLAECDGVLAAYAQIMGGEAPPCVKGLRPIQLKRFYVDKPYHGKGVAHRLMEAVDEIARERGAQTVWLGVWEENYRAQAFYGKYGFRMAGREDFHVGTDRQTDLILERAL